MVMETKILDSLLLIFNRQFLIHINQLSDRINLAKDLGMSEYEQNEMLLYVENMYNIDIDKNVNTVGELVKIVENKIATPKN